MSIYSVHVHTLPRSAYRVGQIGRCITEGSSTQDENGINYHHIIEGLVMH